MKKIISSKKLLILSLSLLTLLVVVICFILRKFSFQCTYYEIIVSISVGVLFLLIVFFVILVVFISSRVYLINKEKTLIKRNLFGLEQKILIKDIRYILKLSLPNMADPYYLILDSAILKKNRIKIRDLFLIYDNKQNSLFIEEIISMNKGIEQLAFSEDTWISYCLMKHNLFKLLKTNRQKSSLNIKYIDINGMETNIENIFNIANIVLEINSTELQTQTIIYEVHNGCFFNGLKQKLFKKTIEFKKTKKYLRKVL